MTASLAEIEIDGGISGLRCPITGTTVIDDERGFDPDADHSPYLRFFVDWVGGVWAADPADLVGKQVEYQRKVIRIFENPAEEDNQNQLIAKCIEVLPKSALILEILNPPVGSFGGEICYACFDLGGSAAEPRIRLQGLDYS